MIGFDWLDSRKGEVSTLPDNPDLSRRWVQGVLIEGRLAFEREMERERRGLEAEFERFWRKRGSGRDAAPA